MKWWWRADRWLIDQLEKLCHKFQRLTGRTNFWLAAVAAWIIVYCDLASAMSFFLPELPRWVTWLGIWKVSRPFELWMYSFGVVIWIVDGTFGYHYREKQALTRLELGLANPSKIFLPALMFRWVITVVAIQIGITGRWLPSAMIMASTCWLQVCDPLPPQKSKVREWIESLSARLVPVGQEE